MKKGVVGSNRKERENINICTCMHYRIELVCFGGDFKFFIQCYM